MSGIDESEIASIHIPDTPPQQRSPTPDSTTSELMYQHDGRNSKHNIEDTSRVDSPPTILPKKILTKADSQMANTFSLKVGGQTPPQKPINLDSEAWLRGEFHTSERSPQKYSHDHHASDPRKLELITPLGSPESQDPAIV